LPLIVGSGLLTDKKEKGFRQIIDKNHSKQLFSKAKKNFFPINFGKSLFLSVTSSVSLS
jgi:hypothetical protein